MIKKSGWWIKLNNGVSYLMKKNKIDVFHGMGSFVSKNEIAIQSEEGARKSFNPNI